MRPDLDTPPPSTYPDEVVALNDAHRDAYGDEGYWARYDRLCDYTPAADVTRESAGIARMAAR